MKELYALVAIVIILILAGIINDTNRTLVMSISLSTLMLAGLAYLITTDDNSTPLPPPADNVAVQYSAPHSAPADNVAVQYSAPHSAPPVQKPDFPEQVGPTVDTLTPMKPKDIKKALKKVNSTPMPKFHDTGGIGKKAILAGTMLGSASVAGGPTLTLQDQPKFVAIRGVVPEGLDPTVYGFKEGQSLIYYSPVQFPLPTDNPAGEELANKALLNAKYKYDDDDEPSPLLPQQEKQEGGYLSKFFSTLRTCA